MPTKEYCLLEQHIIKLFENAEFKLKGKTYKVILVDKPRPSCGECKTDVYILAQDKNSNKIEIKISVKLKSSNEFQENKVSAERAEAYFGENWADIISKATKSIKNKFEERSLIYVTKHHPTSDNSITLGWKLEIANKERALSVKAPLTNKEIRDFVYKGINQNSCKKDALVKGNIIKNSGIADYILISEIADLKSVNDVLNTMIDIDDFTPKPTYLIFTANNYRTKENKADGPRPLAVYIEWTCKDNKLCYQICYDKPLKYTGENDMKPILLEALCTLGKKHPCDFADSDVNNPSIILY